MTAENKDGAFLFSKDTTSTDIEADISQLSLDEHEQSVFDVHGIASIPDEDPHQIAQLLQEMQDHVRALTKINATAYEESLTIDPEYTEAQCLWMKFLRCTRYDPHKAAVKLLYHFECKKELFGFVARDVTLEDIPQHLLEKGNIQLLPERDASGRSVISVLPDRDIFEKNVDNMVIDLFVLKRQ